MAKWWNQAQEIQKLQAELKRQAETIKQLTSQLEQAGIEAINPQGVSDEEKQLVKDGKAVAAIKAYRERTGADLLTAKNAIDSVSK
ncbi:hypothetical protein ACXM2N_00085 [Corynebacterium sp. ZY180755]